MAKDKTIKIDDLQFDDLNANNHTAEGLQLLEKSITQNKFGRSVLVDKDGRIIAGNGVVESAKKLGHTKVRVIETDGDELIAVKRTDLSLDSKEGRELAIADNSIARVDLEWNDENLKQISEEWDIAPEDWGVDLPELKIEEKETKEDNYTPGDNVPKRAERGDIFQLGEHRLMCGDSTSATDVAELMDGVIADLVFTDPPYGMKKENEGVTNDNLNYDDLLEFNKKWIPLSFDHLKENGSWYCWGIDEPLMDIYANILKPMQKKNKITFRNLLTWDKGDAGAGGVSFMGKDGLRSYPVSDEKCLFVMCGVQGFNNNTDNYYEGFEPLRAYLEGEAVTVGLNNAKLKEICGVGMYSHWFTKAQFAIITENHYNELHEHFKGIAFKKTYKEIKELLGDGKQTFDEFRERMNAERAYFDNTHDTMKSVWDFRRCGGEERKLCGGHATPKPLALCGRAIKSSSRENETVLDLFGGSGSTLIACEQLGRICRMMEYEPHYCDVIINRWETITGKEAIKL